MKDKLEFERMFREWFGELLSFAYHYLRDMEASRDIVHDAFEYVWRNFDRMEADKVRAYLYSIVRSRCIDCIRQLYAYDEYAEFIKKMINEQRSKDDIQLWKERMKYIRKAMQQLTPLTREVLERCYIEQKSYKQVAKEMNMSVSSVNKHIVKALRLIREEMKKYSV